MQQFQDFFEQQGFQMELVLKMKHFDEPDFVAVKRGSNFMLMRYVDFFFVKQCSTPLSWDKVSRFHEQAKVLANRSFKLPKALRLTVPNINSVLITSFEPSKEIQAFLPVVKNSIFGGEQDSIFIVDKTVGVLYSSGREQTKITGEARMVWGNKKEFATINGRNRAHNLIESLMPKAKKTL